MGRKKDINFTLRRQYPGEGKARAMVKELSDECKEKSKETAAKARKYKIAANVNNILIIALGLIISAMSMGTTCSSSNYTIGTLGIAIVGLKSAVSLLSVEKNALDMHSTSMKLKRTHRKLELLLAQDYTDDQLGKRALHYQAKFDEIDFRLFAADMGNNDARDAFLDQTSLPDDEEKGLGKSNRVTSINNIPICIPVDFETANSPEVTQGTVRESKNNGISNAKDKRDSRIVEDVTSNVGANLNTKNSESKQVTNNANNSSPSNVNSIDNNTKVRDKYVIRGKGRKGKGGRRTKGLKVLRIKNKSDDETSSSSDDETKGID